MLVSRSYILHDVIPAFNPTVFIILSNYPYGNVTIFCGKFCNSLFILHVRVALETKITIQHEINLSLLHSPALFFVNAFLDLIERRGTVELCQWKYLDVVVESPRLQSNLHVTTSSKHVVVKVAIQQEPFDDAVRHRQHTSYTHL